MASNTPTATTPTTANAAVASSSQQPSGFAQLVANANPTNNPYFLPTYTDTTTTQQTSQPDIVSVINGVMQQMVGRFATPEEIQRYGAELLAAERANPSTFAGKTTYQAESGKRNIVTGSTISTSVSPVDFITNLIRGTAEARDYTAATGYFDAMQQSNNKFRSAFSG